MLVPEMIEGEVGYSNRRAIELHILKALASQAQGNGAEALAALEQALSLAEPGGYVRIFVDEGPPMAQLLYEAAACGIAPDYTGRLLAVFPSAEPAATFPVQAIEMVEPEKSLYKLKALIESQQYMGGVLPVGLNKEPTLLGQGVMMFDGF